MDDWLDEYVNTINTIPRLSVEEEENLWNKIQQDNREAREQFIKAHLYVVYRVAMLYKESSAELHLLDLICEGNLALVKSLNNFNFKPEKRFKEYVTPRINKAIERAITAENHQKRIALHLISNLEKLLEARRRLIKKLNRLPFLPEIAFEMKKPLDIVERLWRIYNVILSQDEEILTIIIKSR